MIQKSGEFLLTSIQYNILYVVLVLEDTKVLKSNGLISYFVFSPLQMAFT